MQVPIASIATLATEECDAELQLLLTSLRAHHAELPVFVATTPSFVANSKSGASFRTDKNIHWLPCISRDRYGSVLDRSTMERAKGVFYSTLHCDFMMEKSTVMSYAMEILEGQRVLETPNVLFVDSDVVFLDKLPLVPPDAKVGVSPHRIRQSDEQLFGKFNGGWLYVADPLVLHRWRMHTRMSRFYDQASIEDIVSDFSPHCFEFEPNCNYGYWRMFQAPGEPVAGGSNTLGDALVQTPVLQQVQLFGMATKMGCPYITYSKRPLQSIHTHLLSPALAARSRTMPLFNRLMTKWIIECAARGNSGYKVVASLLNKS